MDDRLRRYRAAVAFIVAAVMVSPSTVHADGPPYRWSDNWPTHLTTANGLDIGLNLKFQRDGNWYTGATGENEDPRSARRHELGFYLKKPGAFDAVVAYDFLSSKWLDVFARMQTAPWLGRDAGALRLGYSKTPVSLEGNTGTGSTTFMETALPTQAFFESRRLGMDWSLVRTTFLVSAGYYPDGDLQGGGDGHTVAARAAWVPLNAPGHILHLGISLSHEYPEWTTDGRGIHTPPTARLQAEPEASLVDQALVDSGALVNANEVHRRGLELVAIDGPWSLQAEYLQARVSFRDEQPAFHGSGYYAFVSWFATGESRPYAAGNVSDVRPRHAAGALELALRYSQVDLDDGAIQGGRESNWTLGANWYLTRYFKIQANWIHGHAENVAPKVSPNLFQMRAQVMF